MTFFADILDSAPFSGVMFADFGDLVSLFVFLIIAGATAFFNWLKNRRAEDWTKEQTPPGAPPRIPSGQRKVSDWEAELRRMLEMEEPKTPPPMPPIVRETRPPPRIPSRPVVAPPPPVQPSPVLSTPPVFGQVRTYKGHCENCGAHIQFPSNMMGDTVICPRCHSRTVLEPFQQTPVEDLMHRTEPRTWKESAAAYQRATELEQKVASRMEEVTHKPVQLTSVQDFKKRSVEIEQVVALLRKPQTARQGIIASVILGPPRALEN